MRGSIQLVQRILDVHWSNRQKQARILINYRTETSDAQASTTFRSVALPGKGDRDAVKVDVAFDTSRVLSGMGNISRFPPIRAEAENLSPAKARLLDLMRVLPDLLAEAHRYDITDHDILVLDIDSAYMTKADLDFVKLTVEREDGNITDIACYYDPSKLSATDYSYMLSGKQSKLNRNAQNMANAAIREASQAGVLPTSRLKYLPDEIDNAKRIQLGSPIQSQKPSREIQALEISALATTDQYQLFATHETETTSNLIAEFTLMPLWVRNKKKLRTDDHRELIERSMADVRITISPGKVMDKDGGIVCLGFPGSKEEAVLDALIFLASRRDGQGVLGHSESGFPFGLRFTAYQLQTVISQTKQTRFSIPQIVEALHILNTAHLEFRKEGERVGSREPYLPRLDFDESSLEKSGRRQYAYVCYFHSAIQRSISNLGYRGAGFEQMKLLSNEHVKLAEVLWLTWSQVTYNKTKEVLFNDILQLYGVEPINGVRLVKRAREAAEALRSVGLIRDYELREEKRHGKATSHVFLTLRPSETFVQERLELNKKFRREYNTIT